MCRASSAGPRRPRRDFSSQYFRTGVIDMTIASKTLGARLLNRLKFRQKLLLLPLLAGVGFVVVLVVSIAVNLGNQHQLELIEKGYYPAVSTSESLNQMLKDIQRGLQDAV